MPEPRSRTPEPPYAWLSKEALRRIRAYMQGRDQWQKVSSRLCFYTALCEMASNRGTESFRASQKALADLCGLSDRTQREILADLRGAGVLIATDPEDGGQGQKTYSLLSCPAEAGSERAAVGSERSEVDVNTPQLPTIEEHIEKQGKNGNEVRPPVSPKRSNHHPSRIQLVDDEHIIALKQIFQPQDVDRAVAKCRAWLLTPKGQGKAMSKRRLDTFLRDADPLPPTESQNGHRSEHARISRDIDPASFAAFLSIEYPNEVSAWTPKTAPERVIKTFHEYLASK